METEVATAAVATPAQVPLLRCRLRQRQTPVQPRRWRLSRRTRSSWIYLLHRSMGSGRHPLLRLQARRSHLWVADPLLHCLICSPAWTRRGGRRLSRRLKAPLPAGRRHLAARSSWLSGLQLLCQCPRRLPRLLAPPSSSYFRMAHRLASPAVIARLQQRRQLALRPPRRLARSRIRLQVQAAKAKGRSLQSCLPVTGPPRRPSPC